MEYAAKLAEDTSQLTVEPGNRFDAGYSQGRFEAGARIRAELQILKQSRQDSN